MKPQEDELVRRAQAGDTLAFAQLVAAHQQFVYNLALRGSGDAQEAEDLAQEAFVRAWLGLPRFRQQARFRTWLYRIVVNLCYNRLPRLRQELAALELDALDESAGGGSGGLGPGQTAAGAEEPAGLDSVVEAQERREFLYRQIEHLPEAQRMLVLLRYRQDLSYEEIAEVMGIPLGTVKTGLFRAHRQLREALRAWEGVRV